MEGEEGGPPGIGVYQQLRRTISRKEEKRWYSGFGPRRLTNNFTT